MLKIRLLRCSLLAAAFGATLSAHAGLFGSTVDASLYAPSTTSVYSAGGSAVVGTAVEYQDLGGYFSLDLTDDTLTITQLQTSFFVTMAMLGPGVKVTQGAPIVSAAFVGGHAPAGVTVEGGRVFVNFSGINIAKGEQTVVSVATQPVPEPASLLALGLGSMAALRRARRR